MRIRPSLNRWWAMVAVLFLAAAPFMAATAAFQASDVIGQRKSGGPAFTINGANNSPNDIGLRTPKAVAVDAAGQRLFVSDFDNKRILVFSLTATGTLAGYTAVAALGAADTTTVGSETVSSSTVKAFELIYDGANQRLFAADQLTARVLVFDVATVTNGEGAVNVLGRPNFTSTASGVTSSTLNSIFGMAYDSANNRLFVTDARRILVFDTATITNGEGAVNVLGQPDFTTYTAPTYTSSTIDASYSMAYDSTNHRLFAGDALRILVFDTATITNGESAVNVLGQTNFTNSTSGSVTSSTISTPTGMTYDSAGSRLFVSDSYTNHSASRERILVFDVATSTISNGKGAGNVLGQADFTSAVTTTTASGLSLPRGMAYHATGTLLYAADQDNNRVMVWNVASITNGEAAVDVVGHVVSGAPSFIYAGIDNGPGVAGLSGNQGMAMDSVNHRLFVADRTNNRVIVHQLNSSDNFPNYDADYVLGQPDMYTDSATTTAVKMNAPQSVAFDPDTNRLFVADTGSFRVLVFDVSPGTIANGMAASNVLGQPNFTTSTGGLSGAQRFGPASVIYDTAGQRLFVSDSQNGRVLIFNAAAGTLSDFMSASRVIGFSDFTSSFSGQSHSSSTVYNPNGLAYDSANQRLFVGDANGQRVMVFNNVGTSTLVNGHAASFVLGRNDFTTPIDEETTGTTTTLSVAALAYDALHTRLFVADGSRVVGFDVATSSMANGKAASVVLGQSNFTSNDCGTSATLLCSPTGLLYDSGRKRLYIGDTQNNRIVAYDHVKITTESLPAATVGVQYFQEIGTQNSQGTVAFAVSAGTFPPGMTIGSVDGTPTAAGTYAFTIQASDQLPQVGFLADTQSYTLVVNAATTIAGSSGGSLGFSYTPPTSTPAAAGLGSGGSAGTPAATTTISAADDLAARLRALRAQLAQLLSSLGVTGPFTRNLRIGSIGDDVRMLQRFLNVFGYPVATTGPGSRGQETSRFGGLTRAALARLQQASGITPPLGYFGPLTRAFVNALLEGR